MAITRYFGQPLPIVVAYDTNPLEVYGKTYADITEVRMNFKQSLAEDADDAYLQKSSLTNGVLIDQTNHQFTMVLASADYNNLDAGSAYYITLNVLVVGFTEFIELDIEDRKINIVEDTNRS